MILITDINVKKQKFFDFENTSFILRFYNMHF